MPSYKSLTIKKAMQQISEGKYFLPAIQRKFVWTHEQIEKLFDSIMRDYPIGTFLFWMVEDARKNDYVFYKFLQNYSEFNNWKNELAPKPLLPDEITGVLDGQQRLNSMYVALQGTYAYRKKRARKNNPDSYPRREFHLNVFHDPNSDEEEDGTLFEFKFLTKDEAKSERWTSDTCWVRVKQLLECDDADDAFELWDDYWGKIPEEVKPEPGAQKTARKLLSRLWNRLNKEELINFFPVENQNLDEILDIFVRVNSAGKELSKTDLLFSTIVAHWEEGRDEIETFLQDINDKGSGFGFNTDFMMRSCLVLTEAPVRLRVDSFRGENVRRIIDSWEEIKTSVERATDLLVEWGFQKETLPAMNAAIPLAYAAHHGLDLSKSKEDFRLLLIKSLLTGIYSGHGDQLLTDIRKYLRDSSGKSKVFSLDDFESNAKLPSGKSVRITEDDLENFLMEEKGPRTFMLLSLLVKNLKFEQVQFHQDHIHPYSGFYKTNLRPLQLTEEQIEQWQELRDCLPNLQLMEGAENQSKNKTPFAEWLASDKPDPQSRDLYLQQHLISTNVSLDLKDFETFFEDRKEKLRQRLREILKVRSSGSTNTDETKS